MSSSADYGAAAAAAEQLSARERAALDQFRAATADLSPPCREDWYLLKWLRARKFDLNESKKMLKEHIAWRKKNQVDSLLDDYRAPEVFLKYCPGGAVECSPDGRPVLIVPVGRGDFKGILEVAPRADLLRHCIYLLESLEELKRKITLQHGGRRIQSMYVVADMEGFSFWQLSSIEVVSAITEAVRMYEDNYPEVLEEAYLVNAPNLFPMLWSIVKPLLTERTTSKIHIFGKEGWRELLAARWDVERLPVHWGGRLRGPDGDGRCTHMICPGGPVPGRYRRKWLHPEDAKSHTVEAGSCWTLPVSVREAGSELRWSFGTASGDVSFAVRFRPPYSAKDGGEVRDLVAPTRVPFSRHAPHSGSMCCREPGTCEHGDELVFDNSFSWLTRKDLSYTVDLLPPPNEGTGLTNGVSPTKDSVVTLD